MGTKAEELAELQRAGMARDPRWAPWRDAAYSARLFKEQLEAEIAEGEFIDRAVDFHSTLVSAMQAALWMVEAMEGTSDENDAIVDAYRAALATAPQVAAD